MTGAMSMSVDGFATAQYEVAFPRRIDITFKSWLGATVRANEHVEFQILQIENCFYSFLQLAAILFILYVYAINEQMTVQNSKGPDGKALFMDEFWDGTLQLDYWLAAQIEEKLMNVTSAQGPEDVMRLASSEVLLPAVMYVFVCIVSASEHAMFSGMDTLSESREDRWYRRAVKCAEQRYAEATPEARRTTAQKALVRKSVSWSARFAEDRGYFVVTFMFSLAGCVLGVVLLLSDYDPDVHTVLLAASGINLSVAVVRIGSVFRVWRSALNFIFILMLRAFLFCGNMACPFDWHEELKQFSAALGVTDRYLRSSFRLDKRELSVMKHVSMNSC